MPTETISGVSNTPNNVNFSDERRLKKACKDFEAIFITNMLKEMRKSIPKSDLLDSSHASEIYRSMMDQKIAEKIAHGKGLGLGEILSKQLQKYYKDR